MTSLKEFLTHPVTAVTAVLGTVSQLFQTPLIDAFGLVLWDQIRMLSVSMSLFAFRVVPNVDLGGLEWLGSATQSAAIVFAIGYGLKILLNAFRNMKNELDND